MTERARWRTKPDFIAQCEDGCGFEQYARNAQALAAQHHDKTGHKVRVEVSYAVIYGEDSPGQRRWWRGRE